MITIALTIMTHMPIINGNNGYLIEFDDVWMVEHLEHLHFSVHLLEIQLIQTGFIDDFDGHLNQHMRIN